MRGLYILLFAVIYSLAELVLVAIVVFQFVSRLFTGGVNARLLEFGQQLSRYLYDLLRFFTFNSETRPFPFSPWPEAQAPESAPAQQGTAVRKKSTAGKKAATKKRAAAKKRSAGPAGGNDDQAPGS